MQLLAENVYASAFAYRSSGGKRVKDFFPDLFIDDDYEVDPPVSEEDRRELQTLMDMENARLKEERKSSEE
jgi:hypothetical protein